MNLRIEFYDGCEVLQIALDSDGVWHRSEFPDELITLDYNAQDHLIGLEAIGSAARDGAAGLFERVTAAAQSADELREQLMLALS
jgi:hypothetical protein